MTLSAMQRLLQEQDLCVLATSSSGGPHCSLMAYLCSDDCTSLFMVTPRNTKKFANLCGNPVVSVLVDNRKTADNRGNMQALTINGRFSLIEEGSQREEIKARFLQQHPQLESLIDNSDACFFAIKINELQLLTGATDAQYASMT